MSDVHSNDGIPVLFPTANHGLDDRKYAVLSSAKSATVAPDAQVNKVADNHLKPPAHGLTAVENWRPRASKTEGDVANSTVCQLSDSDGPRGEEISSIDAATCGSLRRRRPGGTYDPPTTLSPRRTVPKDSQHNASVTPLNIPLITITSPTPPVSAAGNQTVNDFSFPSLYRFHLFPFPGHEQRLINAAASLRKENIAQDPGGPFDFQMLSRLPLFVHPGSETAANPKGKPKAPGSSRSAGLQSSPGMSFP